jgi:hypothetical protein
MPTCRVRRVASQHTPEAAAAVPPAQAPSAVGRSNVCSAPAACAATHIHAAAAAGMVSARHAAAAGQQERSAPHSKVSDAVGLVLAAAAATVLFHHHLLLIVEQHTAVTSQSSELSCSSWQEPNRHSQAAAQCPQSWHLTTWQWVPP